MASSVVANRSADIGGQRVEIAQQSVQRCVHETRVVFEGGVQLAHVPLVMFRVMDLHRVGVDMGFQRVVSVGKIREFVSHVASCRKVFLVRRKVDSMAVVGWQER